MHHLLGVRSALCLMVGSGFVIVWANDVWERLAGMPVPVGLPVAEVFAGPRWRTPQAALGEAYRTWTVQTVEMPTGILSVTPWVFQNGEVGVATKFVPRLAAQPHRPRTAPRPAGSRSSAAARPGTRTRTARRDPDR